MVGFFFGFGVKNQESRNYYRQLWNTKLEVQAIRGHVWYPSEKHLIIFKIRNIIRCLYFLFCSLLSF